MEKVPIYHPSDNPVGRVFQGRIAMHSVAALYKISNQSIASSLLHAYKYKGRTEIGRYYGKRLAQSILAQTSFDAILPIPLHPKKLRQRGYNQSEILAHGIAEVLNIPVLNQVIQRKKDTPSQTHKSRIERWQNVSDAFSLKEETKAEHILIVDDVITTGATIEACAQLLNVEKISVVSLACAY